MVVRLPQRYVTMLRRVCPSPVARTNLRARTWHGTNIVSVFAGALSLRRRLSALRIQYCVFFDAFCDQRTTWGNGASAILKTRSRLARTTAVKMGLHERPTRQGMTRYPPKFQLGRPSRARQPFHLPPPPHACRPHHPTNSDPVNLNCNGNVVVLDDVRPPMHNCPVEEIFSKPDDAKRLWPFRRLILPHVHYIDLPDFNRHWNENDIRSSHMMAHLGQRNSISVREGIRSTKSQNPDRDRAAVSTRINWARFNATMSSRSPDDAV